MTEKSVVLLIKKFPYSLSEISVKRLYLNPDVVKQGDHGHQDKMWKVFVQCIVVNSRR